MKKNRTDRPITEHKSEHANIANILFSFKRIFGAICVRDKKKQFFTSACKSEQQFGRNKMDSTNQSRLQRATKTYNKQTKQKKYYMVVFACVKNKKIAKKLSVP